MQLLEIVKDDYARFPEAQTYSIYDPHVFFKDPVYEFRGLDQYKKMIGFITYWFSNLKLELHDIQLDNHRIHTRWTMSWNAPLPWKPRISVTGRSELEISSDELIISHIDYWDCSRFAVVQQHFRF
ncbi:hypothetical protein Syn7502_00572 [Synechococcus sp. PCC 7502]|uniref:DUF2358 domain-containing protein n=1 Tax=Synechococcus sp. PCC 7502 TaxID=1173263 RepID=UPI00029FED9D|nr:DUF2358 domain-containing protein [Synechococcus sp. PCC 7502]AFY72724.1 hypothetical protein Syn7502_00572 [Synechococcus sp. PCC 7502]